MPTIAVTQAVAVTPTASNSKDDSMSARKTRNASNSTSISRDANRSGWRETIWKPTTRELSRIYSEKLVRTSKNSWKDKKEQKIHFFLSGRFQSVDTYRTVGTRKSKVAFPIFEVRELQFKFLLVWLLSEYRNSIGSAYIWIRWV